MERDPELSQSEDEFDFTMLNEEISAVHKELQDTENNSSSDDSDKVRGVRRRKIRVIDSEYDSDTYTTEDSQSYSSEWITCTESEETPSRIPFIAGDTTAGPHAPLDKEEPFDFFKLFVTDEMVNEIVIETNNYAAKKLYGKTLSPYSIWRNWRNVTIEEMWAFIGVIINMGTMPLANLQEYWSRNDTIQRQDAGPRTRLQLVSCFLDYINSKFVYYFTPGREICVDESTIKFQCRVSFIAYNPKKPTKRGIRVYAMADSTTGYICGILPYYGSLTTDSLIRRDLPVTTRIPLHLYSMLLEKLPGAQGHHMFTDRYYTSYILAEELLKLKCHLTGTILTNRKHLPEQIKKIKFGKKSTVAYRKGNTLCLAWKDKRVVTCLTN
ncbi:piggyBac transposable element-derived protein 1-like [Polistes fuscatus]|uniref:piggyBac transposable element-derived protein 1-like n=1 Tax=Polistes fuscatus TaxID=30207 RepID=UPI001CA8851A|nr:piggyBac transposable element-derived protein 1-like [Polistes fuscatus]